MDQPSQSMTSLRNEQKCAIKVIINKQSKRLWSSIILNHHELYESGLHNEKAETNAVSLIWVIQQHASYSFDSGSISNTFPTLLFSQWMEDSCSQMLNNETLSFILYYLRLALSLSEGTKNYLICKKLYSLSMSPIRKLWQNWCLKHTWNTCSG